MRWKTFPIYLYQRLTIVSSHSEGFLYINIPKAYRRLHPLERLVDNTLYRYIIRSAQFTIILMRWKPLSIYLYQRLTIVSTHSEGFLYIDIPKSPPTQKAIPKAYRKLHPLQRLVVGLLYIVILNAHGSLRLTVVSTHSGNIIFSAIQRLSIVLTYHKGLFCILFI